MIDYKLDPQAVDDLRKIWRFLAIERTSQQAAKSQMERMEATFALLARQPMLGQTRDDLAAGVRAFVCRPYVILYRADPDCISIAQIVHGSRDIQSAFRDASN